MMSPERFHGSMTALITPFKNGAVDEKAFQRFVAWQIEQGTHGLVPCGTTGESATLSIEEHDHVVGLTVKAAKGRVPVIAGCGSNDTAVALHHMESAAKAGADVALVVCPYYNKPGQRGLIAHFRHLADQGPLPILIYNIPGRSGIDMATETMAELAAHPNIIGCKESTGDIERVSQIRQECGRDFLILSGNDYMSLGIIAHGGHGAISVTANVAPKLCAEFQAACAENNLEKARELNDKLYPLHYAMFDDASPGPVKYALSRVHDWIGEELRLPLVPCSAEARKAVDAALEHAGLV